MEMKQPGRRWFTVQEAAQYLGCSRNFLDKDRITKLHGILFTRLGRHIRYDRTALDDYLISNQTSYSVKIEEHGNG